ncbi:PP2C family protein-serine/threonine phosphatase [Salinivirga cyanobacteriivorans]
MLTDTYINELEKQVADLKEQVKSGNEMFEMTTNYMNKIQNELKASEANLKQVNKQLTDSINYARHIQKAFITGNEALQQIIPKSFLFFRPKDILSGDFLWVQQDGADLTVAVGDCTGHGVPGAMLTVYMISTLNQVYAEVGKDPAQLLGKLDEYARESLNNSSTGVADSAEIGIINYNLDTGKLVFAGANRPLVRVRKGKSEKFRGSRYILGRQVRRKEEIVNQEIPVESDDMVYLFSDGFVDQFGGPQYRKYSTRKLRHLLEDVSKSSVNNQFRMISTEYDQWKGQNKQIDDTVLLGMRM